MATDTGTSDAPEATSKTTSGGTSIVSSHFSLRWTRAINTVRKPIYDFLHVLSRLSAENPKRTVSLVTFFSIAILLIGLATNFQMDSDEDMLWTPRDSEVVDHRAWIDDHSGFPEEPREFFLFFHNHGGNVIEEENIHLVFEALDAVRGHPNYETMCRDSDYLDENGVPTCRIFGVTKFWNDTTAIMEADTDVIQTMSGAYFPDQSRVNDESIFGYSERDADGRLTSAQSIMVVVYFADTDMAEDLEKDAVDKIVDLDDAWQGDSNIRLRVEVSAYSSFEDEMARAIVSDVGLVPLIFIIMSLFCVLVFFRRDRVKSRSLLGFMGVVCVLLSLCTGYGLMFVCGVPLTAMTQLLPFIVFGIGLDDVFILTCSYDRMDSTKSAVERVADTIDDVGLSITMTSLTSSMAFGLGCLSTIPAIFWLCLYGFPTVIIVYLYQITFFVACMVLDERRVEANKRDCCCCLGPRPLRDDSDSNAPSEEKPHVVDRLMERFSRVLLKPYVKIAFTIFFLALAAGLGYSAAQLEQGFDYKDMLPDDSYLKDAFEALEDYQARSGAAPFVYFRDVNQSDPAVQANMTQYIMELVNISAIEEEPEEFWLWDFQNFTGVAGSDIQELSFEKQLELFLADPAYRETYIDHIVVNDEGQITSSRCLIFMDNVDWDIVTEQIDALHDQRSVTKRQPVNHGRSGADWAFFTYFGGYDIWELYATSVVEIIKTTIIGVFAVTGVSLLLIPHWSAALFVFPFICLLYVDLLGFIQVMGLEVNAVTYIGMVMSIGLLVDFIMHILLRYYESSGSREEKTVQTLKTMGSSIFLGGVSSLLGTLGLSFASSSIFFSVFVVFFGLVVLGVIHGLIFLPIILSTFGPEDQPTRMETSRSHTNSEEA